MATIQYPWRFMMVWATGISIVSGLLVSRISSRRYQMGVVLISLFVTAIGYGNYAKPLSYLPENWLGLNGPLQSDQPTEINIQEEWTLPQSVQNLPKQQWKLLEVVEGQGTAELLSAKANELVFIIQADTEVKVKINRLSFPGWELRGDNQPKPYVTDSEDGLILATFSPGRHESKLVFTDTPVRRVSNLVSLVGLVIWLGWGGRVLFKSLKLKVKN